MSDSDWQTLVENHTAPVRYPFMRRHLRDNLESLSSLEYQQRVWLDPKQFDCFDEVIHCLFDDLGLAD